jgi:hypothetical protein
LGSTRAAASVNVATRNAWKRSIRPCQGVSSGIATLIDHGAIVLIDRERSLDPAMRASDSRRTITVQIRKRLSASSSSDMRWQGALGTIDQITGPDSSGAAPGIAPRAGAAMMEPLVDTLRHAKVPLTSQKKWIALLPGDTTIKQTAATRLMHSRRVVEVGRGKSRYLEVAP